MEKGWCLGCGDSPGGGQGRECAGPGKGPWALGSRLRLGSTEGLPGAVAFRTPREGRAAAGGDPRAPVPRGLILGQPCPPAQDSPGWRGGVVGAVPCPCRWDSGKEPEVTWVPRVQVRGQVGWGRSLSPGFGGGGGAWSRGGRRWLWNQPEVGCALDSRLLVAGTTEGSGLSSATKSVAPALGSGCGLRGSAGVLVEGCPWQLSPPPWTLSPSSTPGHQPPRATLPVPPCLPVRPW